MVFCQFLRCPQDSSGCASKCFYKGCLAAHTGEKLCSLEISVVLQSHLPQIEPFQVHPSILAVSKLKFWKSVLDNEWIYFYRLKISTYCYFIFKQEDKLKKEPSVSKSLVININFHKKKKNHSSLFWNIILLPLGKMPWALQAETLEQGKEVISYQMQTEVLWLFFHIFHFFSQQQLKIVEHLQINQELQFCFSPLRSKRKQCCHLSSTAR